MFSISDTATVVGWGNTADPSGKEAVTFTVSAESPSMTEVSLTVVVAVSVSTARLITVGAVSLSFMVRITELLTPIMLWPVRMMVSSPSAMLSS